MRPLIAHIIETLKGPQTTDNLQPHKAIQRNFSHASKKTSINKITTRSAAISTIIVGCCTAFVPRGLTAAGASAEELERETQKKGGAVGDRLHSNGVHDAAEIEPLRRGRKAEELYARPHVCLVLYGQR
jgi:hypothetical protein